MCAFFVFFPAHKQSQGHGGKGGKDWSFRSRKYLGVLLINEGWMKGLQWCGWCTGVFSEFSSLICDCELWADTKTGEWGYRWTVWASSSLSRREPEELLLLHIWTGASYTIPREVTARCLDRRTDGQMDGWMMNWHETSWEWGINEELVGPSDGNLQRWGQSSCGFLWSCGGK